MTITIEQDFETDRYVLMCDDGKMSPMPAGYPSFGTLEEAEAKADEVRAMLGRTGRAQKGVEERGTEGWGVKL